MSGHPLDRPVWNALATRQAALVVGDARAVRFASGYAIFAAAADPSPASLSALAGLIGLDGLAMVEANAWPLPPGLQATTRAACVQMLAPSLTADRAAALPIEPLGDADAPAMLDLATRTQPGPFFERTHRLGGFVGLRHDGRLVAMAGERMKPDGFTEVSGVCTDPAFRGRGYAGALMRVVAARVVARGETPFLHAYAHNLGAIGLYESLGFRVRCEMMFTVLAAATA